MSTNLGNIFATLGVKTDKLKHGLREGEKHFDKFANRAGKSLKTISSAAFSLKGAIAGIGAGLILRKVARDTINVAASFEQLELKLDKLTKGKGVETLEEINAWALRMPVDTQKAVDAFAMMKAFGLDPTIKSLETLVDVSVIFGEEAMGRVALALGQMSALGKVSAQDLNQLAQVGIGARQIIKDTFGVTFDQLEKHGISTKRVIKALMESMEKDFGGAAREGMSKWQGLTLAAKSYIVEIQRAVMNAGVFDMLKKHLSDINKQLENWLVNNQEAIKQKVPEYVDKIERAFSVLGKTVKGVVSIFTTNWKVLSFLGKIGGTMFQEENPFAFLKEKTVINSQRGMKGFAMPKNMPSFDGGAKFIGVAEEIDNELLKRQKDLFEDAKKQYDDHQENIKDFYIFKDKIQLDSTQLAIKQLEQEGEAWKKVFKDNIVAHEEIDKLVSQGTEKIKEAAKETEKTNEVAQDLGLMFSSAFEDAVVGGNELRDVLQGLLDDLLRLSLRKVITEPLFGGVTNTLSGLFGNAEGNIFSKGRVVPFSKGGITNGASIFPMANGTGLMGENGAEGILPLERIGGKLGVNAIGGGGVVINIIGAPEGTKVQESESSGGGRQIDIILDEKMAENAKPGSRFFNEMTRNFSGLRPELIRR